MLKSRKKKTPRRVLALPDLEQAKSAVLNPLTSVSGQRTYDHAINDFVEWYCSEPRLAFNRTVVLRYRIYLEQKGYAPNTINLRLAAVRRVAYEACDPAGNVGHRHATRKTEPHHSGDAHRVRPPTWRTSVIGDGFDPGSRGAWVIADLKGKAGHSRTVPVPQWEPPTCASRPPGSPSASPHLATKS